MKGDGDSLKDTTNNVTPVRTNTAYTSQKGNVQKEGSLTQKESSSASLATTPTAKSVVLDLHANPEVTKQLQSSCHVMSCCVMFIMLCYFLLQYVVLSHVLLCLCYVMFESFIFRHLQESTTFYFYRYYPILSYLILSYPIQSYPILSCPIQSYPILSYPILSYPIPS